jgi:Skp family chaperone for outer membrane proteins
MKRHFLVLILILTAAVSAHAQGARGIRIGYIDMEYILQNVPDYLEAKNQLEQKAQKWKQEMETKKNEINKQKDNLKTERALLTKELLAEREEEIAFLETELSDYQQKKFGPTGELVVQKAVLVKPIQDQVFTAVQDIAEAKKYDFVFDKSSDMTMIFSAKRFDISDQVVRVLSRAANRDKKTKKELKQEEIQDYKESLEDNPTLVERQKKLDERKAAREKLIEDRKAAADAKKAEAALKRQQILDDKAAKRTGGTAEKGTVTEGAKEGVAAEKTQKQAAVRDSIATSRDAARQATADAKAKTMEERKKALDDKKAKALADREAAKKAREEKTKKKDSIPSTPTNND